MSVCRRSVTVNVENGLHLIPGSLIAQAARRFDCNLTIRNGQQAADAKNVLDIIALGAVFGTTLDLEANGQQATEAIEEMVRLFELNFEIDEVSNS